MGRYINPFLIGILTKTQKTAIILHLIFCCLIYDFKFNKHIKVKRKRVKFRKRGQVQYWSIFYEFLWESL